MPFNLSDYGEAEDLPFPYDMLTVPNSLMFPALLA